MTLPSHSVETYAARRTEGKPPREIKRCLKRAITREIYRLLEATPRSLTNPNTRLDDRSIFVEAIADEVTTPACGWLPMGRPGLGSGVGDPHQMAPEFAARLAVQFFQDRIEGDLPDVTGRPTGAHEDLPVGDVSHEVNWGARSESAPPVRGTHRHIHTQ